MRKCPWIFTVLTTSILVTVNAAPRRGAIETCIFKDSIDFSAIKGRLMRQMSCDALQGIANVRLGSNQEGQPVKVLQIISNNKKMTARIITLD
jgi:hypothetical protein